MRSEDLLTPSQTVGPYLHIAMGADGEDRAVPDWDPDAITLSGIITDGAGEPVTDGLVEVWHVDADPTGRARYGAWARAVTDESGRYVLHTRVPDRRPTGEAPHLTLSIFARGLLDRLVTRIYLPWEERANRRDPVFSAVDEARRPTLVASGDRPNLTFDIRLRGRDETVFFEV